MNDDEAPRAQLTDSDILEIRRLANTEGWPQGRIARRFQRTIGTIGRIVRGETHQHVGMVKKLQTDPSKIAEEGQRMLEWQEQFKRSQEERTANVPEELKPKKPNPYV